MPQSLTEPNRAKLDSIVQRMTDAGESDDDIRFVVSDFKSKYALPDKPVSAEDFLPPAKSGTDKAWDYFKGVGRSTLGQVPELVRTAADLQAGMLGGDLDAAQRTSDRLRGMVGAQVGQFGKARERFAEGRGSEGVGHTLGGLVPLIGPAFATAAEGVETDPYGAAGEIAGLASSALVGPKVAPRVPAALQAAGRGTVAAGRGVASAARKAGPIAADVAGTAGLEVASQVAGGIPGTGVVMRALLEPVLGAAKARRAAAAAETPLPPLRTHGPDIEASLRGSVSPPLAVHGPEVSPAFGGTLVGKAPSVEAAVADALTDAVPSTAARTTLPPPLQLPAGYTPRTTVPKPRATRPERAPKAEPEPAPASKPTPASARKRADTSMGPANYFLRKDVPAAVVERPAPRAITVDDLPESWKAHIGQVLTKPGKVTKATVDEMRAFLDESGLSADEAIDAVARDASLPPWTRIALSDALKKTQLRKVK